MAAAEFRIFLNNDPADPLQVDAIRQIRVDQAVGMATEAELSLDIAAGEAGDWPDMFVIYVY